MTTNNQKNNNYLLERILTMAIPLGVASVVLAPTVHLIGKGISSGYNYGKGNLVDFNSFYAPTAVDALVTGSILGPVGNWLDKETKGSGYKGGIVSSCFHAGVFGAVKGTVGAMIGFGAGYASSYLV